MDVTTYSNFRQRLKYYLDLVLDKHEPVQVTRKNGEDVIVMPKSDYDAMQETFYLLRSPKNAERLLKGIEQYEKGDGKERALIED